MVSAKIGIRSFSWVKSIRLKSSNFQISDHKKLLQVYKESICYNLGSRLISAPSKEITIKINTNNYKSNLLHKAHNYWYQLPQ